HELDITHVAGALVLTPPAGPRLVGQAVRVGPFRGRGDIFDRRVEPDIEDLSFHPRPRPWPALHRNSPVEVAGDAAVFETLAVFEPFPGNRGGEHRPVVLRIDPGAQAFAHETLAQIEVPGLAYFQVPAARDRRTRTDKIGGVELPGAVLALISARPFIVAIRTGPLNIAVGQKASVGRGIDLAFRHFGDQPRIGELPRKM